jgi:multidrug efflux pump subunit AcrA (membrane-fusion protein)
MGMNQASTASQAQSQAHDLAQGASSLLDLVEQLGRFDGPPERFVTALLALQCHIAPAAGGAVLRRTVAEEAQKPQAGDAASEEAANQPGQVLAVYPPQPRNATPPVWLAQAAELTPRILAARQTQIMAVHKADDLYGQPAARSLICVPLHGAGTVRGMAAFLVESSDRTVLALAQERLELTVGLLSVFELRLTLQKRNNDMRRLQTAIEVTAAVNEQDRGHAAMMAACNEIAGRWRAHRVGVGFLAGRYVKVRALSHTEKFTRKMRLVQDIEAAMEECFDQDTEVVHPAPENVTFISRAAAELSARHGPSSVCSLPMRHGGEIIGVLTVQRAADEPFDFEDLQLLRLTADLLTARIYELHTNDHWFGHRLVQDVRRGLTALVGPRHTWAKAAAILGFAAVLFLTLAQGADRVKADFAVEPTVRRVISAPFDGVLAAVHVEPGEPVAADGTVLAELDTAELRQQLLQAQRQRDEYLVQADTALRDGNQAERALAMTRARQVAPTITLLQQRIEQARLRSPISGMVLHGDHRRRIGAPVTKGDALFEVGELYDDGALRAQLLVPESRIEAVAVGQRGRMAAASHPADRLAFTVEKVNPVAEVIDGRNVFRVRVRLEQRPPWLRPGMEGVAKVDIGRAPFGYLWTRDLINWVRMRLWW